MQPANMLPKGNVNPRTLTREFAQLDPLNRDPQEHPPTGPHRRSEERPLSARERASQPAKRAFLRVALKREERLPGRSQRATGIVAVARPGYGTGVAT
jgi:hypothetical protein